MSRAETIAKKVDEKIKRTLELQSKGLSKNEIAEAMETTPEALSKFMKRYGYKSENNVFKVDDKPKVTKCNTNVKQNNKEQKKDCKTSIKQTVIQDKETDNDNKESSHDFGKDILPTMLSDGEKMIAYPFKGYWKDVGTVESLWEANMDLLDLNSGLNLHDPGWRIFSSNPQLPPQVITDTARFKDQW